ncbi:hypothetical protein FOA43_000086 [Brettanomyces nanus]|uniref:HIG1 domain-containing protein n=1 Tax=Eeniella nana TaxID=13502 RepID=A0A875RZZ4_EENNA|nr:uncharacterized protein FOA43_000086 [Brettanomyces nanus]QPG72784.1 hypothetical protein FOA43_000086 [Brettanomyces nanus]
MKVISDEELKEHNKWVLQAGLKGAGLGVIISLGIFGLARYKFPTRVANMTWSVRTGAFVIPPAFCITVNAANASESFGSLKYNDDVALSEARAKENDDWSAMTGRQKTIQVLNSNKYKIITGLWALSMWGSWKYVSRDKLLSKSQKFYDARMYAQFITIVLLLGSIGLSMMDDKDAKNSRKFDDLADDDYMRQIMSQNLQAEQAQKEIRQQKAKAAN